MSHWDYLIALTYVAGTVACGFYFARRQTTSEQYFLGGRGFGWFPLGLSMVATLVSTTSFLAFPSETYEHSLTIACYIFGIPPALLVVQKVFIPFYRRQNLTSIYEYLEVRFGIGVRVLTSAMFVLMRLVWMAVAVHTAALAVSAMTDLAITPLIFAIGATAVLYATLGGLSAVIWTDVVQFFIFFGGLAGAVIYVALKIDGGLPQIFQAAFDAGKFDILSAEYLVPDPRTRITVWWAALQSFTWLVATYGSDQLVAQRYLAARSTQDAIRSIWANFVLRGHSSYPGAGRRWPGAVRVLSPAAGAAAARHTGGQGVPALHRPPAARRHLGPDPGGSGRGHHEQHRLGHPLDLHRLHDRFLSTLQPHSTKRHTKTTLCPYPDAGPGAVGMSAGGLCHWQLRREHRRTSPASHRISGRTHPGSFSSWRSSYAAPGHWRYGPGWRAD